jgi:DNA-binding NarL/FixJ family response regulator
VLRRGMPGIQRQANAARQRMEKRIDIPRIMVVAAAAARRSEVGAAISRALRGRVHIISNEQISQERFSSSGSEILVADLDTPATAAAVISFLEAAPAATGTVILTDDPDPTWVRAALGAGVNAILAGDAGADDLLLAIHAAEAGLVLLHPTSVRGLAIEGLPAAADGIIEELTGRECQVLRLVSAGLGNKEIADRLAISEHTVKFHISSILGKLNVASRTEAVSLGIRRGIIPI